jgi:hypothetical protein
MTPELQAFLSAEDLDDALRARHAIHALEEDDQWAVEEILFSGTPPQAVANLLLHPSLIPSHVRVDILRKNLREPSRPYFALAASVGVQEIDPRRLLEADRAGLVEDLWAALEKHPRVSGRALISLLGFLRSRDAEDVAELLDHADSSVRHNALAWLIRQLGSDDLDQWIAFANEIGLTEETLRVTLEKLDEHNGKKNHGGHSNLNLFVAPYIPSLSEFEETS